MELPKTAMSEDILPKNWTIAKLSAITNKIVDGTHFTPHYQSSGVPFISVKDIYDGKIYFDNCKYISREEHNELSKRCKPERNDILITKSGTIGRIAVVKKDIEFSLFVSVALIKPFKEYIMPDFVAYALENYINSIDIQQTIKGGVIKNFHIEDLKEVPIPIAPLEQQKRIVSKIEELFTKLDAGIGSLKKAREQLKRYRQSVLNAAFEGKLTEEWRKKHEDEIERVELNENLGEQVKIVHVEMYKDIPITTSRSSLLTKLPEKWIWTKFASIASVGQGGTPSTKRSEYWNGDVPWIRSGEIRFNFIESSETKISRLGSENSAAKVTPKGTVLLAMTGEGLTRGRVAILEIDAAVNQSCATLRINPEILINKYVFFYLWKEYWNVRSLDKGSNQPGLNTSIIKTFNIPVPSIIEQAKIIESIDGAFTVIDHTEAAMQNLLKQCVNLRLSLLNHAFQGKLVPQDPNDVPAQKLLELIKQEQATRASVTRSSSQTRLR